MQAVGKIGPPIRPRDWSWGDRSAAGQRGRGLSCAARRVPAAAVPRRRPRADGQRMLWRDRINRVLLP